MTDSSKHKKPVRWVDRFLEWYCADHLVDEIQGDLYEDFYHRSNKMGVRKANLWFFLNVLRFFRPSSFGKYETQNTTVAMHKNYFKTALRNFAKNKVYSTINLLGLILGTTSCLLITLHVMEELSYDNFHPESEHTYRLVMDMFNNGELSVKSAPVFAAVGPVIDEDFPEIEENVRILPFGNGVYSVEKEDGSRVRFNEENAVLADENYFRFFGFRLIDGKVDEVLSEKNQVVLSRSTAKRYFGDRNPIGKSILYRGQREYIVSGVMEDFPENSHMQFDIIASLKTWDGFEEWPQNWGWYDFYTYIRVHENTDREALAEKAAVYLDGKKAEDYAEDGSREVLELQNVEDIHLYSKGYSWEMGNNGGANNVYFLSAIAVLILIIAWVNFINLSTARAVKRAREVGIRKVVGARRENLVQQFLLEAFIYNLLAITISIVLVIVLVPAINAGLEITLERSVLLSTDLIVGLTLLLICGSLISGLYPAVVLSAFRPLNVLKGNLYSRRSRFGFRQILVVFQFTTSIILILGTIVVVKQLRYMQSQDLGLDVKQTLVLKGPSSSRGEGDLTERRDVFVNRISQLSSVNGFTGSNVVPGVENFSISSFATRQDPNVRRDCYRVRIDERYFEEFGIDVLAGRNFIKDFASDSNAVLLNRTAAVMFGFSNLEEAVGETLNPTRYPWKVVGVVEDYHHSSLKESLDPIMFYYRPNSGNYFSLKISGDNVVKTISDVEDVWDDVYPDNPFEFFFLDQHFDRQYRSDKQFNAVFMGFAGLAIVVACLGLFGLVSFTVEQSRKEIGIRKVLGASAQRIVVLLARNYALLAFFSILLAFPLGYYLMRNWLQDFAYQTTIGPLVFVFGGVVILLITFITVSFKSISAANSNPVEALREE